MFRQDYLPTQSSKARCIILIMLLIFLYLLDNSGAASLLGGRFYSFLLKPALWLGLAYLAWSFPSLGYKVRLRDGEMINFWALALALIFILVSIGAGFIDGFGRSSYDHSLLGVTLNIWLIGAMLIGRELVRCQLVQTFARKESYLIFVLVALLLAFTNIPLKNFLKLTGYKDYMGIVQFAAQTFAPEVSKNLLAVYLSYLGGPLPSLIYMGVLEGFDWLSPVLPNLKWMTTALVGTLCPVFSLTTMEEVYATEIIRVKSRVKDTEGPLGWVVTSILSIAIVWFAAGLFPVFPSVIATGSMEPMIKPGDIILINRNVDKQDLKVGDIIQFKSDSILISHRIIRVMENNGNRWYLTKGDNNDAADSEPIPPELIKGKIIRVVPKIGWPTLLLRSRRTAPLAEVQF